MSLSMEVKLQQQASYAHSQGGLDCSKNFLAWHVKKKKIEGEKKVSIYMKESQV